MVERPQPVPLEVTVIKELTPLEAAQRFVDICAYLNHQIVESDRGRFTWNQIGEIQNKNVPYLKQLIENQYAGTEEGKKYQLTHGLGECGSNEGDKSYLSWAMELGFASGLTGQPIMSGVFEKEGARAVERKQLGDIAHWKIASPFNRDDLTVDKCLEFLAYHRAFKRFFNEAPVGKGLCKEEIEIKSFLGFP
jgi:hypothetical protein